MNAIVMRARELFGRRGPTPSFEEPPAAYPGDPISSLEELGERLSEAERAMVVSDDDLRRVLSSFWLRLPASPHDPRTDAYRQDQLDLYRFLSGHDYTTNWERHEFDVESHTDKPFPYSTSSADTVGQQFMAIGYIIQAMGLPPGSSILELGFGWANTLLPLAQMGYDVTGIDIEPRFLRLVQERLDRNRVSANLIEGDFFSIEKLDRQFDAVLFYEAFHHCDDHLRLLDAIPRVLAPGGKLVLAGEPVGPHVSIPWGINPAGIALWSIRRHGWLELIFSEHYLLETLAMKGWRTAKHDCPVTAAGVTYVATRG